MATTPYEILNFIGRGVSLRDYDRLKAALDRLQSTTVATSIRQPTERRMHRFSWINEWKERAEKEIATSEIGTVVMEDLKRLDKVAYVRFASVYRHFRDINEFANELKELLNPKE